MDQIKPIYLATHWPQDEREPSADASQRTLINMHPTEKKVIGFRESNYTGLFAPLGQPSSNWTEAKIIAWRCLFLRVGGVLKTNCEVKVSLNT